MSEALLTNIESLYNPKNYNIKHTLLLEIDKLEDLITKCDSLDKLDDAILKNLRDDKDFTGIKIFNVLDDVIPNKDAFYDNKFASIDKRFFKEKSC